MVVQDHDNGGNHDDNALPRLEEEWSLRQSRRSLTLATFSLQLEEVGQLEYSHFFLLLLYHSLYHRITHCSGINEIRKCMVKLIFTERCLKPLTFAINWGFKDFRHDIPIYVNHIQLVPAMQEALISVCLYFLSCLIIMFYRFSFFYIHSLR